MATEGDREILNTIFNPLLPLSGNCVDEYISIPEELKDEAENDISDEAESAKKLELEGVKAAEKKEFEKAVEIFNRAIEIAPNRASGYNNRAQAYRLMGKTEEAMIDLNNAINLSSGKGKSGCQAFCQRGLIQLKNNNTDAARKDFESAARLGSHFARAQLVQMNPYAALCNKMLKGVFDKLQRGESEDYTNNSDSKKDDEKN